VVKLPEGRIIEDELDLNKVVKEFSKYSEYGSGALLIFIGLVKGLVDGKKVYELEYSAYEPYASEILDKIAAEESRDDGIYDIRIYHRIGSIKVGEPTLYIIISGGSRKDVISKMSKVVERVKKEPYIFKLEKREDGEFWVYGDGRRFKREKR